MIKEQKASWRCMVCGYIHVGDEPPEYCPVCGAGSSDFERYVEPSTAGVATDKASQWKCLNCNYIADGESAPDVCPLCGATSDSFEVVRGVRAPGFEVGDSKKFVILGAGIAGVSAAESIRKTCPAAEIRIVARENISPYYRLNLTRLLAGEISIDALPLHSDQWYKDQRIEEEHGVEVADLLVGDRQVILKNGRKIAYDRLILAMGAHPFLPPFPGVKLKGVLTLRTADDACRILDLCGKKQRCVCIGGGILGLETAAALAKQGVDVTLLESHEWLMPRQLNRTAGKLLEKIVLGKKIKLLTQASTEQIVGDGHVAGVLLKDGRTMPADFVIITTGVRPDTYLARRAGLDVNDGVVVDNHLRTSIEDVYAAGDVAEHNGVLYGNWNASMYQGSIAGFNAAGVPTIFGGLPRSNMIKVLGVDLLSIGQFEVPDGSYAIVEELRGEKYFRFVFHDGHLVGAILLGDAGAGVAVKKAVEGRLDFATLLSNDPSVDQVLKHLDRL